MRILQDWWYTSINFSYLAFVVEMALQVLLEERISIPFPLSRQIY